MTRLRLILALVSAIVLIAASALAMRLGSEQPYFFRKEETRILGCYGSLKGELVISIRNGGHAVLVSWAGGAEANLVFKRSGLFSDIYANAETELSFDGEAYVTGLVDRPIGPCN